jgi:hypothetical protein
VVLSDQASLLLKQLNAASIAYVGFAENRDLLDEHDTTLELEDDGSWHVTPAHGEAVEGPVRPARS